MQARAGARGAAASSPRGACVPIASASTGPNAACTQPTSARPHPAQLPSRAAQPTAHHSTSTPFHPPCRAPKRAVSCASAPAAEARTAAGPDFTLTCEETGTPIHVFGVEHTAPQPHIGEWIMRARPRAVIVETALGPEHGALAGNALRAGDRVADPTANFYTRMFVQIGVTLNEYKEGDFTDSPLWKQICTGYNGEQLAYIGAFAAGSPLVFGDRPKDITYRRLLGLTTPSQLDEGYAHAAVANAHQTLAAPGPAYDPESLPVAEQIMMQEREAVMLQVCAQAARGSLPQLQQHPEAAGAAADVAAASSSPAPAGPIALVVGSAHLPGLRSLWAGGAWRRLHGCSPAAACELCASDLMAAPPLPDPAADPAGYGLRRGLLTAMLRMSVTKEVLADLDTVLGPVPPGAAEVAAGAVAEVYSSPRMALACLPRELLGRLVEGRGCDFYELLQPLRDIRPSAGGPGYSEEMVTYVRALNFELE